MINSSREQRVWLKGPLSQDGNQQTDNPIPKGGALTGGQRSSNRRGDRVGRRSLPQRWALMPDAARRPDRR